MLNPVSPFPGRRIPGHALPLEDPTRTPRLLLAAGFCASAAFSPLLSGCGSDGNGGTEPNAALYASWNATSFQALGTDFIADGMTLTLTFDPAGTYTLAVTNDLIGTCDPGPDCINAGDFTATATQITLDPGSPDGVTLTYAISGTNMTFTGAIDGNAVTITFERV